MLASAILSGSQLADHLSSTDPSPGYYRHYPRLFALYFNTIEAGSVDRLCDAGYLYYQFVLLIDRIIDDKDFSVVPASIVLQEESIKLLTSLFGVENDFWKLWNARRQEYFKAVGIEKKLSAEQSASFEAYADLADKKAAFGKVAIDCMWLLSSQKDREVYHDLLESHRHFSIGFQLCDDVKDFKEDIVKGQFNWGVYLLNQKEAIKEFADDASIRNKLFYIRGVAQQVFTQAIDHFKKALEIVERMNIDSEWKDVIIGSQKNAIKDLDIANHYIETLRKKIESKKQASAPQFFMYPSVSDSCIKGGLDFIRSQFADHYTELKHRMYLGKLDGFDNTDQVHESDTFPRALLNDCLLAIARRYNIDVTTFLAGECDYLIEQRNMDDIGGWGYFPTVKEIAADIDDLAQVMQLFTQLGREDLVMKFCARPIQIALTERASEDGGIETWIIPKYHQTETQKKQELFNQTRWGKGPDVEVVANFIYALYLADSNKYQEQISKSLDYIVSQRKPEGYWESVWYYGDYYGTYACLRVLSLFENKFSSASIKAIEYIRKTQNADGGFGLSSQHGSDPLSTSLAVLAYSFYTKKKDQTMSNALDYLKSCQLADGSWPAIDFIKPKLLEPYRSKTMTTGFVLKALIQFE
jgi:squalene-hopene/tetraprenyl-beta-curcumene cyclase